AALRREGVAPAAAARALAPPPLRARTLSGDDEQRRGIAFVASLLLYLQLIVFGLAVASGVVAEKSSRIVEVLLAAIPPRALLAVPVLAARGGTLAVVPSLLPLTAPIVMPARAVRGEAGAAQIAASLGLLVLATALIVPLAARIYENSVLRIGKPLKLREG